MISYLSMSEQLQGKSQRCLGLFGRNNQNPTTRLCFFSWTLIARGGGSGEFRLPADEHKEQTTTGTSQPLYYSYVFCLIRKSASVKESIPTELRGTSRKVPNKKTTGPSSGPSLSHARPDPFPWIERARVRLRRRCSGSDGRGGFRDELKNYPSACHATYAYCLLKRDTSPGRACTAVASCFSPSPRTGLNS